MESLALIVSLILGGIVSFGVVSVVLVIRPARRSWLKWSGSFVAGCAVLSGVWLATRPVAFGGRFIGSAVAVAGASALWRTWKRR